jgi:hypothetical protein
MDLSIDLEYLELCNYLLTQSNIDAAIDNGDSLESVERWINEGIKPFFIQIKSNFFIHVSYRILSVSNKKEQGGHIY